MDFLVVVVNFVNFHCEAPCPWHGLMARRLPTAPSMVARQDRVSLGNTGEDIACAELQRRGYAIIARQFRTRAGEIDIIARDGCTLVFVEVRTRASHDAGSAAESVTRRKRDQIGRMAAAYLGTHGTSSEPCRFDVVTVEFENADNAGDPIVTVYPSAFELGT